MARDRIYPVPVKPPSSIVTWSQWPDDVVDRLHLWNRGHDGHRLSFRYTMNGSIFGPSIGVFKCPGCDLYCEPHPSTTSFLDDGPICDDCLIAFARDEITLPELRRLPVEAVHNVHPRT